MVCSHVEIGLSEAAAGPGMQAFYYKLEFRVRDVAGPEQKVKHAGGLIIRVPFKQRIYRR